ncbi:transferase family-domain-containing protein [Xylaria scruposa]|nr:transferase family-domain-containing protein [Xylaria scruposa]
MAERQSIKLSPMDNVMPRIYANFIFSFRLNPGPISRVYEVLQESLQRTCDELPILAQRVFTLPPDENGVTGKLEVRESVEWTPSVVFNDLCESWPDYDELVDSGLEQDLLDGALLLPKEIGGHELEEDGAPVLVAQANFVQGGLLLAFGIFHPVIDGHSGSLLMKLWAKHSRSLQQENADVAPTLAMHPESADYGLLERIWRNKARMTEPTEILKSVSQQTWRLLGLLAPSEPSTTTDLNACSPKMRTTIFYVPASNFEALRNEANQPRLGGPPISTQNTANDALMAKLWRCTIKARAEAASETDSSYAPDVVSLLDLTLDGRALFSQELPWSYMGTLVFISTTPMSVGKITDAQTSLTEIATNIRQSVQAITTERLQEAFGLARSLPDYGKSLRFPFATFEGAEACFTSWIGLSAFDIGFGDVLFANGGRADYLRPPRREYDSFCRRCVVLPMQVSGGFEILVTMKDKEMDALEADEEFTRYAKVVCH